MNKNEIILDKQSNFITRYGSTLEDSKPSVIYLRTKSKITPLVSKKDYSNEIAMIKTKFTDFVKKTVYSSKSVLDEYLFNIDITEKSIKYGKISNLKYDIYLKPTKLKSIEENKMRLKQLSIKLDKKLEKLLNTNNIICQ